MASLKNISYYYFYDQSSFYSESRFLKTTLLRTF